MNRVFLITGADSDMGTNLVKRLAKPDDFFILQGLGQTERVRDICRQAGAEYACFKADFSDESGCDDFVRELRALPCPTHYVHLPALKVINARFKNFDEDRFAADFAVQVTSRIKISKYLLPKMARAKYGRVVFMATSYVLANPPKNTAAYVTAKSALVGLCKALAAEYAPYGVTVNCVSPSMTQTKFLSDTNHLIIEARAKENPMGRNATVDDITPAVEFLLSDGARFITGVNLPVTGGSVIE